MRPRNETLRDPRLQVTRVSRAIPFVYRLSVGGVSGTEEEGRMKRVHGSKRRPRVYAFRTITDLSELPVEMIRPCLTDLMLWLQAKKLMTGVTEFSGEAIVMKNDPNDVFNWVDDGRHLVTIELHVRGAGGL